jgi:hypothetical protein
LRVIGPGEFDLRQIGNFAVADTLEMRPVLFKCPATGQNVQWSTEEVSLEKGSSVTYKSIACPACTRLHFVNPFTGRLLGEK